MTVPVWLTFLVAGMVILFGLYRIRIALASRNDQEARKRGGLYRLPRRTHFLFGALYLILGGFLIAAGMGWIHSPFASEAEEPEPVNEGSIPIESTGEIEQPTEQPD